MNATFAIALLIAIIVAKAGVSQYQRVRMQRAWETGFAAFKSADLETAATQFGRCVKWAPIWVEARRMLGLTLARLGRHDEAETHYKFALELEPRNADTHLDFAAYLTQRGPEHFDLALVNLEKALNLAPKLREKVRDWRVLEPLHEDERFQRLMATRVDEPDDKLV
jgi:Tfp pilus assembly protein PilF